MTTATSAIEPRLLNALLPLSGRRVQAGDIELFVTDSDTDGIPLVFLHGLGWTHGLWRHQRTRYGQRWRMIAGDNRGHGQSDTPPGPYTLEGMARDWLAALDTMGIDRFVLVGFSQGSRVAQLMATMAPERLHALVVIGAGCRSNATGSEVMARRIEAMRTSPLEGAKAAMASIFSPAFMEREAAFMAHFLAERAQQPVEPLIASMQALQPAGDLRAALARVTCPVLVIVGDADRLCPVDAARELADALPHAEFHVVPDAGHMVTIEQPDAIDALLDAFLDKQLA
ncbi:MAG: alpha/beta fold hydrolase [Burkholderiaceae bacterium]|nr:alpha/beta fold hydrolase [Burkholderiaceae bacterium]